MDDNMTQPLRLLEFPPEVILRISDFLPTSDLTRLRQTCTYIEQHMFSCFAREFFTKRQFMLEEHSLEALVHIANHPNLCKYLTYVIISAEKINHQPFLDRLRLLGYKDAHTLLWTGQARDMLVEAFQKLPNLQTVGVRDYSGPGRYRDGEHARWRSYGWSFGVVLEYELSNGSALAFRDAAKLTFPLVIEALAAAQANPEGIEVFLNKHQALEPNSFNLFRGRLGPRVREMTGKLKRLLLVIGSEPTLYLWDPCIRPTQDFLLAAENLEMLRLNMMFGIGEDGLLDWLSEPPFQPGKEHYHDHHNTPLRLISPPQLPHLQQLDLGFASLSSPTLTKLLTKFPLLRRISLWKIRLVNERRLEGSRDTPTLAKARWPDLLTALSTTFQDSTHIQNITISGVTAGLPPNHARDDRALAVRWTGLSPSDHVPYGDGNETEFTYFPKPSTKVEFRSGEGKSVGEWLVEVAGRVRYEGKSAWEVAVEAQGEEEEEEEEGHEMTPDGEEEFYYLAQ